MSFIMWYRMMNPTYNLNAVFLKSQFSLVYIVAALLY